MKKFVSMMILMATVLPASVAFASQIEQGTVKLYNARAQGGAGLGFITPNNGLPDVVFQTSAVVPEHRAHVRHGCVVTYERTRRNDPRQQPVQNVRLVACP